MRNVNKFLAVAALMALAAVCAPRARAQSGCAQIAGHVCFWVEVSTLSPTAPAVAQVGIPYSQNFTATNASNFSIVSGAATQNGLTANIGSSFSITGTPSSGTAATWVIGWQANGGNFQTSVTVPVATLATSNPITVTPATASVNQGQTQQFKAAANFSNQTSVDVTNSANWTLPSGAGCAGSAVGSTGNFSAGSTPGACTVEAAFGGQDGTATANVLSASGSITIQATSSSTLCNAQRYVAYGLDTLPSGCLAALTATGGTPPYTWSITSASPPSWLTLTTGGASSGYGGILGGTPTAPAAGASITFKVTDSASNSQTVTISTGITVEAISTVTVNAQTPLIANAFGQVSDKGTWADGSTNLVGLGIGTQGYASATAQSGSASASVQVSTSVATTTGDFAVATVASYSASNLCTSYTASVTSPNETFHAATSALGDSATPPPSYNCIQMFYAYNITGNSADQPTCNWSIAAGGLCLVRYYHGMPATDPLDQHPLPTQATAANNCTPNTVTTSQANELIDLLCVPNNATTITPPAGFTGTAVGTGPLMVLSDAVVTSVETGYAPQATFVPASQNEVTALATFKANAAPNGTVELSSTNPACVTINPSTGSEQAQPVTSQCTAVITAAYFGASPTIVTSTVTVNPSITDTAILVKPSIASLPINGTVTFVAVGNVTGQTYAATWGSSNPTLASIGQTSGLATCLAATGNSSVSISATVSGFTVETPGLLSCGQSTLTANSCSEADFFAALNTMVSFSGAVTLAIPSGTCTWSSATAPVVHVGQQSSGGTGVGTGTNPNVFLPNVTSLTVQGATAVSCSGVPGNNNFTCSATDNTVIEDGISASSPSMLTIIAGGNATNLRVTGITFEAPSSIPSKNLGVVNFIGVASGPSLRLDHDHLILNGQAGIDINGPLVGVTDHSVYDGGNSSSYSNALRANNDLLDTVGNGDGAFMSPSDWGTANFFFAEENQFNGGYANDCDTSGRMVERYNTFVSPQNAMQSHPTKDYGGPTRGCRAQEFYHNYINGDSTFAVLGGQGGTWLIWGNTVNSANNTASWFWSGETYRSCPSCNGAPTTNCQGITGAPNCLPPNGWGQAGTDMNYPSNPGTDSAWDGNLITSTGYPPLDGLGRGQQVYGMNGANFPSRAIAAGFPGAGTQAWPDQYLEPIYMWMNSLPSSIGIANDQDFTTTVNRDIFGDCGYTNSTGCSGGFTGAAGTGYGTLANRPSTCTAGPGGTYFTSPTGSYGVAYWATDANGGQGELYVCTSTNTWTGIYSPYTFPHPLDTGP